MLGTRFRAPVAGEVAGLSDRQTIAALEGLTRTGLVADGGGGWVQFAHELVRQAVYDELAPPARAQLHQVAFRALASHAPNPAEAAGHAVAAGLTGDPQAIATLGRAGRAALHAGAVKTARRHLEAAAGLAGDAASDELLVDLARALLADGASRQAVEVCERALHLERSSTATQASAVGLLGRARFHTGDVGRAGACFAAAVRLTEGDRPDLALGALLDQTFLTWAHLGPGAALPLAERARHLATTAGNQTGQALRACADAAWALCAWLTGDPHGLEVAQLAARAAGAASLPASVDTNWALEPAAVPGDLAVWAERFADAEQLFSHALHEAERGGEPFLDFHASLSWSDGLRRLGRLDEAVALADRAVQVAELLPVALPLALSARGLALVDLGRFDAATAVRAQVADVVDDRRRWYLASGYELHLAGALAHRRGDHDAACASFDRLQALLADRGVVDPSHVDYAPDAIDAYLACGRRDEVEGLIDRLERAHALPSRWPGVVAAVGRARLAEDEDPHGADAAYARAVTQLDGLPLPLTRAWVLITVARSSPAGTSHKAGPCSPTRSTWPRGAARRGMPRGRVPSGVAPAVGAAPPGQRVPQARHPAPLAAHRLPRP